MSAVLTACVRWRKIAANPLSLVPKPSGQRQRMARPLPPIIVERIRQEILQRDARERGRAISDALLVSLMAYAGLRPGEALALRFGDIGRRSITIDKAVANGVEGPTKTGAIRSVPLVEQLATDVANWRAIRGMQLSPERPPEDAPADALLFPSPTSGYWTRSDFGNWRNRVWKPAVSRLSASHQVLTHLATARPYDCRGSFVSLQLRAGASPLEVASWAGHSPQVMYRHYASVIEELVGQPRLSVETQITRAREAVEALPDEEITGVIIAATKVTYERPETPEEAHVWERLFGSPERDAQGERRPPRAS